MNPLFLFIWTTFNRQFSELGGAIFTNMLIENPDWRRGESLSSFSSSAAACSCRSKAFKIEEYYGNYRTCKGVPQEKKSYKLQKTYESQAKFIQSRNFHDFQTSHQQYFLCRAVLAWNPYHRCNHIMSPSFFLHCIPLIYMHPSGKDQMWFFRGW